VYVEPCEQGAAAGAAHGRAHKPVLILGARLLQVFIQLWHELKRAQLHILHSENLIFNGKNKNTSLESIIGMYSRIIKWIAQQDFCYIFQFPPYLLTIFTIFMNFEFKELH
jgi:hypothetical protein